MTFWTCVFLLFLLGVFVIAQLVKILNSESKAGELFRTFFMSVINRIRRRKETPAPSSDDD